MSWSLASVWDRMAAVVVDYAIILSPIAILFTSPLMKIVREAKITQNSYSSETAWILMLIFVISMVVLFQTFFIWKWNATPGKMLLGLRVSSINNERITLTQAFIRSVSWLLSVLFLALPMLSVFSHKKRRTMHDRLTETIVVSLRPSRASLEPHFIESALVRSVYWSLGAVVLTFLFYFTFNALRDLKSKNDFITSLEKDGELCASVGESLSDSNKDINENSRLDMALALYGAGTIDINCLSAEVEKLFTVEDSFPILNIARAFIYSDNAEISDAYLNKICADEPHGAECAFSQLILSTEVDNKNNEDTEESGHDAMAQSDDKMNSDEIVLSENEDIETQILAILDERKNENSVSEAEGLSETQNANQNTMLSSEALYPKIWAAKELIRLEQFALAEKHLGKIPKIKEFSSFLMANQTKIYWALGQEEKSVGAEEVAYSSVDALTAIQLSSYMCYEKLAVSCGAISSTSCQKFDEIISAYDDAIDYTRASLVYLKLQECKNGTTTSVYEKVLKQPINEEVRRLVSALMDSGTDGFDDLSEIKTSTKLIDVEIQIRLLERTKSVGLVREFFKTWMGSSISSRWVLLGRVLYKKMKTLNNHEDAIQVASTLLMKAPRLLGKDLMKDMISYTHANGAKLKSYAILENYLKYYPFSEVATKNVEAREPASVGPSTYEIFLEYMNFNRKNKSRYLTEDKDK